MRAAIVVLLLIFHESAGKAGEFWQLHSSGSTVSLRGISAVSESCCWASGARGTVLRTIDRGRTWTSVGPPVTEAADFRDVHAWNDSTAIIMSAGDVDRLYRTEDGGRTWQMVFEERATDAFFDGLTFDAAGNSGWLMGDPLDGQVYLLRTDDGGRSWVRHPAEQSPHVATGVAAFAASGTHLLLRSNRDLLIGLGGLPELTTENAAAASAGVLITTNQGKSWKQIPVPMQSNVSSGIFSLSDVSVDGDRLVAVGGDYRQVQNKDNNIAVSDDGGVHWRRPGGHPPSGFRSAVVAVKSGKHSPVLIATGPDGTDVSHDSGETWTRISSEGFHTMSVSPAGTVWAAGAEGRIARASFP